MRYSWLLRAGVGLSSLGCLAEVHADTGKPAAAQRANLVEKSRGSLQRDLRDAQSLYIGELTSIASYQSGRARSPADRASSNRVAKIL